MLSNIPGSTAGDGHLPEREISHSLAQEGVELLDPQLRQFSELPQWMRANAQRLEGRKVLMYCTGGVRCERASALLKTMGPGFQDVCQLTGGPPFLPTSRPYIKICFP